MKNDIKTILIGIAIIGILVFVCYVSKDNTAEYSRHSCLITTGNENCQ